MEIGQKEAAESKNRIVRKWKMYVGECHVGVGVCMCRMGQSSKMDQKDRAASSEDQDGRGISLRR